jgi:RnfABCDGE-type electron transport complex B subunit
MNDTLILPLIIMGGLGIVFGAGLAIASKIFYVKRDHRVTEIEEILPGVNCGACGAPGCSGFAEGVVEGKFPTNGCTVGGMKVAASIGQIMGGEIGEFVPKVAVIQCRGDDEHCVDRAIYQGVLDCKAAMLIDNGAKGCVYGCLGLGNCVDSCPFDAITMGESGLPVIDEEICVGCGKCVVACPRDVISLIPWDQKVYLACISRDFGKAVKSVCKVGCIGCGLCAKEKTTANEIITMDDKLPVIHYEKVKDAAKDLGNAVTKCPTNSFAVRGEDLEAPVEESAETEEVVS